MLGLPRTPPRSVRTTSAESQAAPSESLAKPKPGKSVDFWHKVQWMGFGAIPLPNIVQMVLPPDADLNLIGLGVSLGGVVTLVGASIAARHAEKSAASEVISDVVPPKNS